MSVIVKKETLNTAKISSPYVPHLYRSHPFYFIGLPLYLTLTTIFYWMIWVPLCYSIMCAKLEGQISGWAVPFFMLALTGYILILAAYIYQWKSKQKYEKNDVFYEVTKEILHPESSNDSYEMKIITKDPKEKEEDQWSTKRQRKRPHVLRFETSRPVSQNLSTSLTPRDLFFIDFINNSYENDKQYTRHFIERERESGIFDMSPNTPGLNKLPESSQLSNSPGPTEYFIANVAEDSTCKSEVFLFVNDDKDNKDCQVIDVKLKQSKEGHLYLKK